MEHGALAKIIKSILKRPGIFLSLSCMVDIACTARETVTFVHHIIHKNGEMTIFSRRFHQIKKNENGPGDQNLFKLLEFPNIRDEILVLGVEYENCK